MRTWPRSSICPAAWGDIVRYAPRLLAITPVGDGVHVRRGGAFFRPHSFELALEDLQDERLHPVLVRELAPRDELHGAEGRRHVRVGEGRAEVFRGHRLR